MRPRWARRAGALAAALVLCTAAACSDDGDGEGREEAEGTTTTSELVFTGDPDSAFCTVLDDLRSADLLSQPAQGPADTEAAFTTLLEVLDRVASASPPELVADTGLLLEGVGALDAALRAVGYDVDALEASPDGATVAAAVNDPAFTVAGDRIEAYKEQVCGL